MSLYHVPMIWKSANISPVFTGDEQESAYFSIMHCIKNLGTMCVQSLFPRAFSQHL
jgi:hypothetical protein